jgi:hypothetical protein
LIRPSQALKRLRDTLLPLLEHAFAYLNELRVRFNVGVQFLRGVRNRSLYAFEYLSDTGSGSSHARLAKSLQFLRARPFRRAIKGHRHAVLRQIDDSTQPSERRLNSEPLLYA